MTRKQEKFIECYIKTLNGAKSARQAGYSERTSNRIATVLLSNVVIKQRIDKGIEDLKAKYALSKQDYIKKTYDLFESEQHTSVRQRYWELLGKVTGNVITESKNTTIIITDKDKSILSRYGIQAKE